MKAPAATAPACPEEDMSAMLVRLKDKSEVLVGWKWTPSIYCMSEYIFSVTRWTWKPFVCGATNKIAVTYDSAYELTLSK